MKGKNQMIKEIDKHLITISDMEDEYEYWDEKKTKENFKLILLGFKNLLIGNKNLLKKV